MPGPGIPGLPKAGAENSRMGCFLQGDRAVIDDGLAAIEEQGFIVHEVHFIVGESMLVQPTNGGVVRPFLAVAGDENIIPPGLERLQKGFGFGVRGINVLMVVHDFQRPEQVTEGDLPLPKVPVIPLEGRGDVRVKGLQLLPQDGGEVPKRVVDIDDDLFHFPPNVLTARRPENYLNSCKKITENALSPLYLKGYNDFFDGHRTSPPVPFGPPTLTLPEGVKKLIFSRHPGENRGPVSS